MELPRAVIEAERKAEEALQRLKNPQQPEAKSPVVQEDPAPAPAPAPTPAPAEGDEKWEARYKTLHGKYNAEVPRLHAAVRERDAEIDGLKSRLDALEAQRKSEPLVKPEEIQEFGEPLVDLMRRAAREEVSTKDHEIQNLKQELASLKNTATETSEHSFYQRLAEKVPDWMSVNEDPEFHTWLAEHDELTGLQRQQILSDKEKKRDSAGVIRFFEAFKKSQSQTSVAADSSLETQVAPVSSRTEAPPQSKKIWTRAEIADFYARDRRSEFTPEQSAAIDKDIQLAVRENRVR